MLKYKRTFLQLLFLVLVGLTVNFNTLFCEFTYDDFPVLVENEAVKNADFSKLLAQSRSVRGFTLAVDYQLFGLNPKGYHLQNIFWHILNSVLIFLLARRLATSERFAFLAALLFTVHPVHTESVANISNRKDILCLFFILASFNLFLAAKKEGAGHPALFYIFSFLMFLMALFSKQVAIVLPLIFLAYEMCYTPRGKRSFSRFFITLLPFAAVFLYFEWSSIIIRANEQTVRQFGLDWSHHLYTVFKTFYFYVRYLFFPVGLSADHTTLFEYHFLSPSVILPLLLFSTLLAMAFTSIAKNRMLAFSIFWFLINWLPVSNIVSGHTYFFAERYLYIPSLAYCFLLSSLFCHLTEISAVYGRRGLGGSRSVVLILALLLVILGTQSVARNLVWGDRKTLWLDTARKSPQSTTAHNNLGNIYFMEGNDEAAVASYKRVLEITPRHTEAYHNLALIYRKRGDFEGAEGVLQKAVKAGSSSPEIYYSLAVVYDELGRYDDALVAFRRYAGGGKPALDALLPQIYFGMGKERLSLGKYSSALASLRNAASNGYRDPELYRYTGNAYMGMGEYENAISEYRKLLQLNSNYILAYYFIGDAFRQMGDSEKALHYMTKFLDVWKAGGQYARRAELALKEIERQKERRVR